MPPVDSLAQLRRLAAAAEEHARREHRLGLSPDAVAQVDRLLRTEGGQADAVRREMLSACYGAWLGWFALQRWDACWVGLAEPSAPRIQVAGLLFSPMDAVRRRLEDPKAPALPDVLRDIDAWSREQAAARGRAPTRNREAWDKLADDPRFAGGELPRDPDALDEWLRDEALPGKALLCLAAGGGRQGPLHAAAGAVVTVVDVSDRQLDHDRKAGLKTLRASMDNLGGLADASFDIVVQPVSSCYVADLDRVHAEIARVLKPGGLYIVQHKQPAALQASGEGPYGVAFPCAEGSALPEQAAAHREPGTTEFVHTLDALIGGLCRAGFVIEAFSEPPRADASAPAGTAGHRAWYLPPYLKIKARRV
ncbi:MAG: methyltransferase domain-containing protein [Planctomycetaceae bacterium]|nr:methyltransferase domain-containing protein [Planctomycetaceae bacterium]